VLHTSEVRWVFGKMRKILELIMIQGRLLLELRSSKSDFYEKQVLELCQSLQKEFLMNNSKQRKTNIPFEIKFSLISAKKLFCIGIIISLIY